MKPKLIDLFTESDIAFLNALDNDTEWYEDLLIEASGSESYIIRDEVYPIIESVLSTKEGDKKFRAEVEAYIDRHSEALHEPCPISLIPFADNVFIGPAEIAFTRICSFPKFSAKYLTLASNADLAIPITLYPSITFVEP